MTSLLIQHLITTTLFASLVWVVCRLAKPAPAARHILWSLVILKLMIPPMGHVGIEMPFAATAIPTSEPNAPIAPPALSTPIEVATSTAIEPTFAAPPITTDAMSTQSIASTASTTPPPPNAPAPAVPGAPINWTAIAIVAWFCGAFGIAALQLIRWKRFNAQTSVCAETPAWLQDEAETVAKHLDCTPVPVTVCNRLSTPAVAGVFRPRILVPSALLERLPRERWRALLAHELAHVKRHDTWWRAIELICGVVWFWNPVFWFARKQARNAAEHACDAWVVWAMPDQRRAYADSLVDVSEWASSPNLPATAIGMSAASRAKLESRLTSIVTGSAKRQVSKRTLIIAAILFTASLPGWAIGADAERQTGSTSSTQSTPTAESRPLQVAQVEAKSSPATTPQQSFVERALDSPVSIEFNDEYVGTILEFLSGYVDINIVLDHTVVEPERRDSIEEMEVVHVGPHWYKHARREFLGTQDWPKSQVVDGMVGPFGNEVSSMTDALDKLLPSAGMTYAITPDCIWITVARPQFEITDPKHQPEAWLWYPDDAIPFRDREDKVGRNVRMLHDSAGRRIFRTEKVHIAEIAQEINDMFARQPTQDGNTNVFAVPPIVVDAAAIAPPQEGDIPKSYLIASDDERNASLFGGGAPGASDTPSNATQELSPADVILLRKGTNPATPVTSGRIPFIKLDNVPLKNSLTALLRPLNLTYIAQPDFIYITSPERAESVNFADRPVPTEQDQLKTALDNPVSIEFKDEYVGTILEFLSGYTETNIVLDSRAVLPKNVDAYQETGTKPVTTGYVAFIKVDNLRLADTLKALLAPLGLDYSAGPGFIWISSPEFIAQETKTASNTSPRVPARAPSPAAAPVAPAKPVAMPSVEPRAEPRPAAVVEPRPATVTRPAKTPGPVVDGYTFRRITRWEDSDARVEIEFGDGQVKWYEIGAAFGPVEIADIDVVANQVVINRNGAFEVVQLAWPIASAPPVPAVKRTGQIASRWTLIDIPYGNVKFGPIARWENSDPRLQVEFPTGQRKWLEVGDAIGNARIGGINIIANQVTVRTPENESRTFDLPRPIQVSDNAIPNATRKPMNVEGRTWTPVESGGIIIGRIARWEDSGDARVEVELPGGEHKWLEAGQSAAGVSIVNIDVVKNRVVIHQNGAEKIVQLPWAATKSEAPAAPRTNPRDNANVGVGDQRWIDYLGDWSRPQ